MTRRMPRPDAILTALLLAPLLLAPAMARAETVLELFTSQSCSSCPPADALLGELAKQPGVLALSMHVDYWNRTGWRDPYSSAAFTGRQHRYAALLHDDTVYTPELVVNGRLGVVGSDRAAVASAIASEQGSPQVSLSVRREGANLVVEAGAGSGPATLWLAGFDPHHETRVGAGENGGRTLAETNIVRSLAASGDWTGTAMQLMLPVPPGERAAVFLQRADGRIIGAASLPPG
jgi:hypothetical protein